MALKFWQKEHLAPLSPDRGEGSGVRGETRLPRAARTVQKDAGFTVAWKSKCKSAMPRATPNRNKIPPNIAAKHPNRAATVREWNHHQIAAPEVPMVHGI